MSNKNILIIGAGFIGNALGKKLFEIGYKVTILSPNARKLESMDWAKELNLINGSILNKELIEQLIYKNDVVINLAGFIDRENYNPIKSLEVNCMGELLLLESIIKVNPNIHHIFLGTRAIFGKINKNGELIKENQTLNPNSIYGIHKRTCEEYIRYYRNIHNLNILSIRSVGIYGNSITGETNHFIDKVISKCINREDVFIKGNGSQIQDFIFIDDIVDLFIRAIELKICGVYNIGSGKGRDIKSIVEYINSKTCNKGIIKYKVLSKEEEYLDLDGAIFDISSMSKIAGWKPMVNIQDGIDKIFIKIGRQIHE